jgi:hypothetical protein
MTISKCSSGLKDKDRKPGFETNLDIEKLDEFTQYLVDVLLDIKKNFGIEFQTINALNEPHPSRVGWYYGNRQEVSFIFNY